MAIPPHERPTAQQLASGGNQSMSFAGRPANVCPHCGAGMFAYRTDTLDTRIIRYEQCRACSRKFVTRQQHAEIIREIDNS